jgi:hypothetical protein
VYKRRTMWFYAAELKNDKFMKKFVLWWLYFVFILS